MSGGKVLCSLQGPVDKRVELDEIVGPVDGNEVNLRPICRLIGAQSRYPSLGGRERPRKRLDFSYITAGDTGLARAIETVDAADGDEVFERRLPRINRPNPPSVAPLGFFPSRVGFRKQPACVERDDIDVEAGFADVMKDDLIFQPKARGENDRSVERLAETYKPLDQTRACKRAIEGGRAHRESFGHCCCRRPA